MLNKDLEVKVINNIISTNDVKRAEEIIIEGKISLPLHFIEFLGCLPEVSQTLITQAAVLIYHNQIREFQGLFYDENGEFLLNICDEIPKAYPEFLNLAVSKVDFNKPVTFIRSYYKLIEIIDNANKSDEKRIQKLSSLLKSGYSCDITANEEARFLNIILQDQSLVNQALFNLINDPNYEPETIEASIKTGGCQVNCVDQQDATPLHHAILINRLDIAKLLINNGANVNILFRGIPLIIYALKKQNVDLLKILMESGKIDVHTKFNSMTLLNTAIESRRNLNNRSYGKIISYLISKGANIDEIDTYNETPLSYAILRYDMKLLNILLEASADVNMIDPQATPLEQAIRQGKNDAALLIIEKGKNLIVTDELINEARIHSMVDVTRALEERKNSGRSNLYLKRAIKLGACLGVAYLLAAYVLPVLGSGALFISPLIMPACMTLGYMAAGYLRERDELPSVKKENINKLQSNIEHSNMRILINAANPARWVAVSR